MQVSGQVHAPAAITRYSLARKLDVHQTGRGTLCHGVAEYQIPISFFFQSVV